MENVEFFDIICYISFENFCTYMFHKQLESWLLVLSRSLTLTSLNSMHFASDDVTEIFGPTPLTKFAFIIYLSSKAWPLHDSHVQNITTKHLRRQTLFVPLLYIWCQVGICLERLNHCTKIKRFSNFVRNCDEWEVAGLVQPQWTYFQGRRHNEKIHCQSDWL